MKDCCNSIVNTLELPQLKAKPSIYAQNQQLKVQGLEISDDVYLSWL